MLLKLAQAAVKGVVMPNDMAASAKKTSKFYF